MNSSGPISEHCIPPAFPLQQAELLECTGTLFYSVRTWSNGILVSVAQSDRKFDVLVNIFRLYAAPYHNTGLFKHGDSTLLGLSGTIVFAVPIQ